VYTTLRNVFTVEVSELLDQVKVIEQQGPRGPAEREFWLSATGSAAGGCKRFGLAHAFTSSVSLELPANRLTRSIDHALHMGKFIK
jgi:hypothetical protein